MSTTNDNKQIATGTIQPAEICSAIEAFLREKHPDWSGRSIMVNIETGTVMVHAPTTADGPTCQVFMPT